MAQDDVRDQDERQRGERGMGRVVGQPAEERPAERRALLAVGVEDDFADMLVDRDGHELLESEAQHEDRCRQQHEIGHGDGMVGSFALSHCSHDAHEDGDEDCDDGGDDHHAQGDEEVGRHLRCDVLAAEGGAQVPVEGTREPEPVALPERVVEVEQVLPGHDGGVRDVRVALQQGERVAGAGDEEEDEDRREEQHDDADQKAPNDVGEHGRSLRARDIEGGADTRPTPPSRSADPG